MLHGNNFIFFGLNPQNYQKVGQVLFSLQKILKNSQTLFEFHLGYWQLATSLVSYLGTLIYVPLIL